MISMTWKHKQNNTQTDQWLRHPWARGRFRTRSITKKMLDHFVNIEKFMQKHVHRRGHQPMKAGACRNLAGAMRDYWILQIDHAYIHEWSIDGKCRVIYITTIVSREQCAKLAENENAFEKACDQHNTKDWNSNEAALRKVTKACQQIKLLMALNFLLKTNINLRKHHCVSQK